MTRTYDGAPVRVPTLAEVVEKLERARALLGEDGPVTERRADRIAVTLDGAISRLRALADEAVTINRIRGAAMSDLDKHHRRVARDVLPNGRVVSTMWLDFICGSSSGGYETMVFPSETDFRDLDSIRVLSEGEALEQHARLVKLWSEKP